RVLDGGEVEPVVLRELLVLGRDHGERRRVAQRVPVRPRVSDRHAAAVVLQHERGHRRRDPAQRQHERDAGDQRCQDDDHRRAPQAAQRTRFPPLHPESVPFGTIHIVPGLLHPVVLRQHPERWYMAIRRIRNVLLVTISAALALVPAAQARTVKPVLHGKQWVAITGKPLAATAGAMIFQRGGNAVDAACAMLAATSTMWDTLGWGGETQALIFDPREQKVIGINALGVAPSGATVEFFREKGMVYPPEYGPLAAVTPGTPGGLMVMLARYGTLSLEEVLEPAMQMADGYPIEAAQADNIERHRDTIAQWPDSRRVLLPHWEEGGTGRAA